MISLFEHISPAAAGLPVDLITRGGRSVSLLTFVTEEKPPVVVEPEVSAEPEFVVEERAERTAAMVLAAREEAAAETRLLCEMEASAQVEVERERVRHAAHEFARDRARFFAAAETQVVKLALAVARRVLEHEIAADPGYLTAIVRAALARVQDGSTSTLRVAAGELGAWQDVFTENESVAVVGDERVPAGECLLETSVGRVELGLAPQMQEITTAFATLAHRQVE